MPLSDAQAGVWFNERLGTAGAVYAMPFALRFDGDLDLEALDRAVDAVVAAHPVLACAVDVRDGEPVLVPAALRPRLVVRPAPAADELDRPFDLETGPLARFVLHPAGPGRHRLLVVVHHLVFDGASTDVLIADLASAYAAAGQGRDGASTGAPAAGEPAQDGPRPGKDLAGARDFWSRRWHEPPSPVLPGLVGPVRTVDRGQSVEFEVPAPLGEALERVAGDLGVTRFELVLASWTALLLRYGNRPATVGVDLGTRGPADRGRIGLYVNELPVAVDPAPDTGFGAHTRALRAHLRELYQFRDVPLARAVPGLKPAVALTPVTLTYRRRGPVPDFPGLRVEVDWVLFNHTARAALRVHLVDGPDRFAAMLQFSPEAMAPAAVRRLSRHWLTLLTAALDAPDTPLDRLPLLPDDEHATLARAWNATAGPLPTTTLPDLVAAHARDTPDAVAVVGDGETLTYRELTARADGLATRLRAAGAGPGRVVAVCLPRGAGLVVGLLGVLRSGAAYLPLDPAHPASRHAYVLHDSDAVLLLTDPAVAGALPPHHPRITLGDLFDAAPEAAPDAAGPRLDGRAYVIYTSGSTGRPKGVAIGHLALANLLDAVRTLLAAGPEIRWLALTSASFDISALELFLPLAVGGRVVVAGDDQARDGAAVCRLAAVHAVTHVQATPSGWRMLLEAGFADPAVTALCGGEPLPVPLARALRERVGALWNMYGPTETTIWSTAWAVPAGADEVRIGRPIANTTAHVLDAVGRPVPLGVPGELHLGGAGVAEGYLGRAELTAQRFVRHPKLGRIYRTGDLVRHTEDGELTYLGRTDDQVKIRGYRVEPGEVEARLLEHPGLAAAAVLARPDAAGDPRLLAWVVPAAGSIVDAAMLRAHLALELPDYMLPAAFVPLDRLPVTPGGKVDRSALPDPVPVAADAVHPGGGRVDGTTEEVIAICQEVLPHAMIGPDDCLFDHGAHSLTMTAIAARIRKRLGADLPLRLFYDDPTPAILAAATRARRTG